MALLSPTLSGRPLYIDLQTQVCASSKVPRCQSSHELGQPVSPRLFRAATVAWYAAGFGGRHRDGEAMPAFWLNRPGVSVSSCREVGQTAG